jgi:hypothetical protein
MLQCSPTKYNNKKGYIKKINKMRKKQQREREREREREGERMLVYGQIVIKEIKE